LGNSRQTKTNNHLPDFIAVSSAYAVSGASRPFNAQVGRLAEKLAPRGVAVGTVDKFQGQEAPVAIYSMTASSPEDARADLSSYTASIG
jgi:superfamily I DNA and/or RNA helicase